MQTNNWLQETQDSEGEELMRCSKLDHFAIRKQKCDLNLKNLTHSKWFSSNNIQYLVLIAYLIYIVAFSDTEKKSIDYVKASHAILALFK